jgi:hypothetical protein
MVWAALAIVVAGVGAVTIFGVSIDLALTYGFFALMIIGHSVMHGGHAGHAGHGAHPHKAEAVDGTDEARGADDRPSRGCH